MRAPKWYSASRQQPAPRFPGSRHHRRKADGMYGRLHDIERSSERAALCTIVRTRGSVPRHEGAKMIVFADGRTEGTVGGGEMESRVIADARAALDAGAPRFVRYALVDPAA